MSAHATHPPAELSGLAGQHQALCLHVDSGHHAGATVSIAPGRRLSIGSSIDDDIYLTDADIQPRHATLERTGDTLILSPEQGAVTVLEVRLPQGRPCQLPCGLAVQLGPVQLTLAGDRDAPEQAMRARSAFLRRHAPVRYLMAEWAQLTLNGKLLLSGCAGLLALLPVLWNLHARAAMPESLEEIAVHIAPHFPHVKVARDASNGTLVYSGYVEQKADIDRLRLHAWNIGQDLPLIRVHAMQELAADLRAHLARMYPATVMRVSGPGQFIAEIPAGAVTRSLDAWDFEQVALQTRRTIPGVKALSILPVSLEFRHATTVPLAQLALNLVTGPAGSYLLNARGEQIYAGAVLAEGTVLSVTACNAMFRPAGKDVVYRLIPLENRHAPCS